MKKIVSIFLAIMAFFCVASIEAEAAQIINNVSVGGIIPPSVGGKAVEMTTVGILYVSDTAPYRMELQSCKWKDENGKTIDNIDYEFEAGRTYSTSMNFYAKNGWTFNSSNNIKVEIKGVNSSKFTYKVTYNDGEIITVNFIFSVAGSRTYPDIKKVEFWNIHTPKEGDKPINSVTHLYDNSKVYTSYWSYNNVAMNNNDTFIAVRNYELNIILDANSGYKFSDDVDVWYYNGPIKCKTSLGLNGTRLIISIPFYVGELKEVSYIEITSLNLPKAGTYAYPVDSNFICVSESEEYRIDSFSTSWMTSSGNVITGNDTFVEGQKYTAKLYFYANEGYRFAEGKNISVRLRGVDYNKYSVEVRRTQTDFCTVLITFTAEKNPPETYITHIDVIGVCEPIAGDFIMKYAKAAGKDEYRVFDTDGSPAVYWYANDIEETVCFDEYTSYTVKIWVEGYNRYFATDETLTATINGKPANVEWKGAKQTMITYTFTATGAREFYNVVFEKNDGTNTSESVKVKGDYRLPNCSFTNPKKNFSGWMVEGQLKQPGEWITVDKDLTIKAVWDDIGHASITVDHLVASLYGYGDGERVDSTFAYIDSDYCYKQCYTVEIVAWYDTDNIYETYGYEMSPSDTFVGGKTYVVEVVFTPTENNIIESNATASIDGTAGRIGYYANNGGKGFMITKYIPPKQDTGTEITEMAATVSGYKAGSITGATKATIDESCVYKSCYTVSIVGWYSEGYAMSKADRFAEEETYTVSVKFMPTKNNTISQDVSVLINGEKAMLEEYVSEGGIYCISVTIPKKSLPGDGNKDGKVSMADLLLLRKYLAGMQVSMDLDAMDVNNDGKVSMADLLLIRKYLAGMEVTLK